MCVQVRSQKNMNFACTLIKIILLDLLAFSKTIFEIGGNLCSHIFGRLKFHPATPLHFCRQSPVELSAALPPWRVIRLPIKSSSLGLEQFLPVGHPNYPNGGLGVPKKPWFRFRNYSLVISCNLRRWCVFCHVRLFLVKVFIDNLRGLVETPTYHLYYIFTYKLFMFVNHFFGYNNLFETCFSQNANRNLSCCIQELFVIPSQAINDVFFLQRSKNQGV